MAATEDLLTVFDLDTEGKVEKLKNKQVLHLCASEKVAIGRDYHDKVAEHMGTFISSMKWSAAGLTNYTPMVRFLVTRPNMGKTTHSGYLAFLKIPEPEEVAFQSNPEWQEHMELKEALIDHQDLFGLHKAKKGEFFWFKALLHVCPTADNASLMFDMLRKRWNPTRDEWLDGRPKRAADGGQEGRMDPAAYNRQNWKQKNKAVDWEEFQEHHSVAVHCLHELDQLRKALKINDNNLTGLDEMNKPRSIIVVTAKLLHDLLTVLTTGSMPEKSRGTVEYRGPVYRCAGGGLLVVDDCDRIKLKFPAGTGFWNILCLSNLLDMRLMVNEEGKARGMVPGAAFASVAKLSRLQLERHVYDANTVDDNYSTYIQERRVVAPLDVCLGKIRSMQEALNSGPLPISKLQEALVLLPHNITCLEAFMVKPHSSCCTCGQRIGEAAAVRPNEGGDGNVQQCFACAIQHPTPESFSFGSTLLTHADVQVQVKSGYAHVLQVCNSLLQQRPGDAKSLKMAVFIDRDRARLRSRTADIKRTYLEYEHRCVVSLYEAFHHAQIQVYNCLGPKFALTYNEEVLSSCGLTKKRRDHFYGDKRHSVVLLSTEDAVGFDLPCIDAAFFVTLGPYDSYKQQEALQATALGRLIKGMHRGQKPIPTLVMHAASGVNGPSFAYPSYGHEKNKVFDSTKPVENEETVWPVGLLYAVSCKEAPEEAVAATAIMQLGAQVLEEQQEINRQPAKRTRRSYPRDAGLQDAAAALASTSAAVNNLEQLLGFSPAARRPRSSPPGPASKKRQ